jgi:hypothetical protein
MNNKNMSPPAQNRAATENDIVLDLFWILLVKMAENMISDFYGRVNKP